MRTFAAILAAILLACALSACRAKDARPAELPARELEPSFTAEKEADGAASGQEPDAASEETAVKRLEPELEAPAGEAGADESVQFDDEPLTLAADIEEIVSYSIRVPQVTLDSAAAAQHINDGFAELADSLVRYAQETVYKTAQEKQTIGFFDADYSITADGGQLRVKLTLTERYAGEDTVSTSSNTYLFDAATGERIITE